MNITITMELTPKSLELLKKLIGEDQTPMTPERGIAPIVAEPPAPPVLPKTAPVDEQPKITAQDVKAVCLKLSKAGKQAELKAAFAKFGGKKLSDIAESDFGALLEELANA